MSLLPTGLMLLPDTGPLGIFGGTFDPVHQGHLQLAEDALSQLSLLQVRWLPAGRPAHRQVPQTTPAHRAAMVALAIAKEPRFTLDRREADSDAPSYSVPSLEFLRAEVGKGRPMFLIVGADAFAGLSGWHRWRELLTLTHIAVAERPAHPLDPARWPAPLSACYRERQTGAAEALQRPAGGIVRFAMTPVDISATIIRQRLARRQPVTELLPAAVVDYIQTHHLYQNAHDPDRTEKNRC
jgi:nicotinate-nucleotide adenylyltransferase